MVVATAVPRAVVVLDAAVNNQQVAFDPVVVVFEPEVVVAGHAVASPVDDASGSSHRYMAHYLDYDADHVKTSKNLIYISSSNKNTAKIPSRRQPCNGLWPA